MEYRRNFTAASTEEADDETVVVNATSSTPSERVPRHVPMSVSDAIYLDANANPHRVEAALQEVTGITVGSRTALGTEL